MENPLQSALSLLVEQPYVTVSTLGEGGFPESRIMFNLRHHARVPEGLAPPFTGMGGGFDSYIATNTSSRKTAQIGLDGRACLYYADGVGYRAVAVMGLLLPCGDPEVRKALWREGWELYYPKGFGDEDYSVFSFVAKTARYYHGLKVQEFVLEGFDQEKSDSRFATMN